MRRGLHCAIPHILHIFHVFFFPPPKNPLDKKTDFENYKGFKHVKIILLTCLFCLQKCAFGSLMKYRLAQHDILTEYLKN